MNIEIIIRRDTNTIKIQNNKTMLRYIYAKDKKELIDIINVLMTKNDLEILDWIKGWCYFLELGDEEQNKKITDRMYPVATL